MKRHPVLGSLSDINIFLLLFICIFHSAPASMKYIDVNSAFFVNMNLKKGSRI